MLADRVKRRKSKGRVPFSLEEDEKLMKIVSVSSNSKTSQFDSDSKKESIDWKLVSKKMGNRSVRQCKERYLHYLSPSINKNEWTEEEDSLLLSLVGSIGQRWKILETFFTQRTEIDIRNRYHVLFRKIIKAAKSRKKNEKLFLLNSGFNNHFKQTNFYLGNSQKQNLLDSNLKNDNENAKDNFNFDEDEEKFFFEPESNNANGKNEKKIDETFNYFNDISDFLNQVSDISFDIYRPKANSDNLSSFFNGHVYDYTYIDDNIW